MKFNWGTGIFLFYTLFAGILFFQVWKSTRYDNSLVVNNYYEQDLAYQSIYNKKMNSNGLTEGVKVLVDPATTVLQISFPAGVGEVNGTVTLYRASDKSKDLTLKIETDRKNIMHIPTAKLLGGHWKVVMDWQAGSKGYYDEKTINI